MLTSSGFLIASLLTPAGPFSFPQGAIPAQTKSSEYAWLEADNLQTRNFTATAKNEVTEAFKQSPNLAKIQNFMLEKFPADADGLIELSVEPDHKFVVSRNNYFSVVSEIQASGKTEIFSSKALHPDAAQIINLAISPNKSFLVIQAQVNGNIDFSRYYIYDIVAKKLKDHFDGLSYMQPPAWSSDTELVTMTPDSSPRLFSALYVDLKDMTSKTIQNHVVYKFKDWLAITTEASGGHGIISNRKTGQNFHINTSIDFLNAVEESESYVYYVLHAHTDGTVFRLKKQDQAAPEVFIAAKSGYWVSTIQILKDKYLLVNYSRDSLVTLILYDLKSGEKISEAQLPDNYDNIDAAFLPQSETVLLTLSNFLGQTYQIDWPVNQIHGPDFSKLPNHFFKDGTEIINRLEYFTSYDGQSIPARITYLKNTKITGKNPTYIETYGAFNYISGFLYRPFGRMKIEFLKRGGILVGTGVRGGAERGYDWYLSGTGLKKANAAKDLIAIANGLVSKGYTQPEKIVSTGNSAGGENVAIAAQLSPESFGLVIPISGAHDSFGYLHLDRWGPQWLFDNLNPYDPQNFISINARSAVELRVASKHYPKYLIVCGGNDTRVNRVHSYKLKASLNEFIKDGVLLYEAENSGHWPETVDLQGLQGLKSNALIWSRIYDYLGLQF